MNRTGTFCKNPRKHGTCARRECGRSIWGSATTGWKTPCGGSATENWTVRKTNTDGEILEGIRAVCREITGKLAKAVIILQGFYPRNSAREGTAERIAGINLLLNRLAAEENFIYTEPGRVMANSDGYVPEELSSDGLHPSAAGYARIAAVLAPVIRQAAEREK